MGKFGYFLKQKIFFFSPKIWQHRDIFSGKKIFIPEKISKKRDLENARSR
jgi:hypothetical protein